MAEGSRRPAWVEIDRDALRHNAEALSLIAAPSELCAVVKADAYGHGAVAAAGAALAGGASSLAVAIVDEGIELRQAGIEDPVLVLSEPSADAMGEAFAHRLTPTLYTPAGIELARASAGRGAAGERPWAVELKVDTGMHRVGADPAEVVDLARAITRGDELTFAGLWTHLAVADEPGAKAKATVCQLERFAASRRALGEAGLPAPGRVHAANSAGAIAWPAARLDAVRCGIALYGYAPSLELGPILEAELARVSSGPLRPALSMKAKVALVRQLEAGERVSYGLRAPLERPSLVATVPLGYADGIPRAYFDAGGEVLVGGRRRRLAGSVTMDQIMVDCAEDDVRVGDEVVLIGAQAGERITAEEWAARLGTISYEIVTRIGPRVPRVTVGAGAAG